MFSMTGYGKAEYNQNGVILTVELKTVNNKNFDLNIKTPRCFLVFEDLIRKTVASFITRARIELFVNFVDNREKEVKIDVDLDRAVGFYKASQEIASKLNISNDVTVSSIMKMPDVITDNSLTDVTELEEILRETTKKACENLNSMREIEGQKLVKDMLSRIDTIENIKNFIQEKAPLVAINYREKLTNRISEILKNIPYDENRLLNEVAIYTDKVNIDEELTRLGSHISQFREIVTTKDAGKKLDFLMQEFNRETNTICSKSNDLDVTKFALSLKNEIEKVREQVQNLE